MAWAGSADNTNNNVGKIMDSSNIKVSVEMAIHNAILEIAKNAHTEFGIVIQSARINWQNADVGTVGKPEIIAMIQSVELSTVTISQTNTAAPQPQAAH